MVSRQPVGGAARLQRGVDVVIDIRTSFVRGSVEAAARWRGRWRHSSVIALGHAVPACRKDYASYRVNGQRDIVPSSDREAPTLQKALWIRHTVSHSERR